MNIRSASFYKTSREHGGAIVEFSLVLPALAFFFCAAFTFGRLISQLAWMSQTGMEAVILGSEYSSAAVSAPFMEQRVHDLQDWNRALADHVGNFPTPLVVTSSDKVINAGGFDTDLVEVTMVGALNNPISSDTAVSWMNIFPISVSVSGPILSVESATSSTSFSNPTILRDCQGNPCTSGTCGPTLDCSSAPCSTGTGMCQCDVGTICEP